MCPGCGELGDPDRIYTCGDYEPRGDIFNALVDAVEYAGLGYLCRSGIRHVNGGRFTNCSIHKINEPTLGDNVIGDKITECARETPILAILAAIYSYNLRESQTPKG